MKKTIYCDGTDFKSIEIMFFSTNKSILELLFITLKDQCLLYEGEFYYSEQRKNVLKDFLKEKWKWNKADIIETIKYWRRQGWLELDENDILIFKFTEVVRYEEPLIARQIGSFHIRS